MGGVIIIPSIYFPGIQCQIHFFCIEKDSIYFHLLYHRCQVLVNVSHDITFVSQNYLNLKLNCSKNQSDLEYYANDFAKTVSTVGDYGEKSQELGSKINNS